MSFFGKNIKKIRSVKSVSQQSFADIFDLKRGTLGAYEEGRSEPKIETIIKIANYFSISIDSLLTRELTVNELLQFKGDTVINTGALKNEMFASIPCITVENYKDYLIHYKDQSSLQAMPKLSLPIEATKELRGFTVQNLEMTYEKKGFFPGDIVIGQKVMKSNYDQLDSGVLIFALLGDQIIFRKLLKSEQRYYLSANHPNIDEVELLDEAICELWLVEHVFCNRIPEFSNTVEEKLVLLHHEISQLKDKL